MIELRCSARGATPAAGQARWLKPKLQYNSSTVNCTVSSDRCALIRCRGSHYRHWPSDQCGPMCPARMQESVELLISNNRLVTAPHVCGGGQWHWPVAMPHPWRGMFVCMNLHTNSIDQSVHYYVALARFRPNNSPSVCYTASSTERMNK